MIQTKKHFFSFATADALPAIVGNAFKSNAAMILVLVIIPTLNMPLRVSPCCLYALRSTNGIVLSAQVVCLDIGQSFFSCFVWHRTPLGWVNIA